tara:strand:- start:527 stop:1915 length:1389 start_codon:yes stop_codon:yes gene_type:complete
VDKVLFKPHPGPQTYALEIDDCYQILFGGSRGPGKTTAGIIYLLKCIENPLYRALVIRRTSDDLVDWIDKAKVLYQNTGAVFGGKPMVIRFPSGAIIRCGHLRDESYEKYQGHEYQRMVLEELTQIPNEESYLKLISSCRSTVKGIQPQIFCTANPGGKGHAWVKARWRIGQSPPNKAFKDASGRYLIYIPATIDDNPTLIEADPDYVKFLESLPDGLRQAWRDGDWDIFAGQYFSDWNPSKQVITEDEAKAMGYGQDYNARYVGIDWGYSAPFCALWSEVTYDNKVFFYDELYGTEKHPSEWAVDIHSRSDNVTMSLGDPSMWTKNPMSWNSPDRPAFSNTSIANALIGEPHNPWVKNLQPANNTRVNGWMKIAEMMHNNKFFIIKGRCPNLERTIPLMLRDEKNPEDVDTTLEDHAMDSCRYIINHIQIPSKPKPKLNKEQRTYKELTEGIEDEQYNWEF